MNQLFLNSALPLSTTAMNNHTSSIETKESNVNDINVLNVDKVIDEEQNIDLFSFGNEAKDFTIGSYKTSIGINLEDNMTNKVTMNKDHKSIVDEEYDKMLVETRNDYSIPGKAHKSANTVLYVVPTLGWNTI